MLTYAYVDSELIRCAGDLNASHPEIGAALLDLKPSQEEFWTGVWRFKLDGFSKALLASGSVDHKLLNPVTDLIVEKLAAPKGEDKRPGRDYMFSVDVMTDGSQVFKFDVAAMNPSDAYFQLTKRFAYKAIPDITSANIFVGSQEGREAGASPVKIFDAEELVFVPSLI